MAGLIFISTRLVTASTLQFARTIVTIRLTLLLRFDSRIFEFSFRVDNF